MEIFNWLLPLTLVIAIVAVLIMRNIRNRRKPVPSDSQEFLLKGLNIDWVRIFLFSLLTLMSYRYTSEPDYVWYNWTIHFTSVGALVILLSDIFIQKWIKPDRLILGREYIERVGLKKDKATLTKIQEVVLDGFTNQIKIVKNNGYSLNFKRNHLTASELESVFQWIEKANLPKGITFSENLLQERLKKQ